MINDLIEKLKKTLPGVQAVSIQMLSSITLDTFYQALDTLIEHQYQEISAILALLETQEAKPTLRLAACQVVAFVKDKRVRPALETALNDANLKLAIAACKSLGTQGDKKAAWALLRVFRNRANNLALRREAIHSLGDLQSKHAVRYLLESLQGQEQPEIRESIAWTLGRIGDTRAIELLIEVLEDPNETVMLRYNSASSLSDFKDDRVMNTLLQVLKKEAQEEVRAAVATALGWTGDVRAVEPLLETLAQETESIRVRGNTAHSLGLLRDTRATAILISLLQHENPNLRYSAANALGNLGDAEAIPALEWVAANDQTELDYGRKLSKEAEWAIDYIQHGGG